MQLYCVNIRPMPNLQCLKLVLCDPWISESELEFNPELFTKFPNLINLHIETLKSLALDNLIKTIALKAPTKLRNLTLLCACTFWFSKIYGTQLPNLKLLTFHVDKLTHLSNLLQVMNNIEELQLSIKHLDDFKDTKIPNTLRKLHIELGSYHQFNEENTQSHDFQTLEIVLLLFPKQLESLTLIAMSNDKHFSDMNKLNALKNIFPHLNSFQYFIQTSHCPSNEITEVYRLPDSTYILQTNPCVVSFGSELRNGVKYLTSDYHIACQRISNLTQNQLYNSPILLLTDQSLVLSCTFKQLPQLRQLCYHFSRSYNFGEAALQKIKQQQNC